MNSTKMTGGDARLVKHACNWETLVDNVRRIYGANGRTKNNWIKSHITIDGIERWMFGKSADVNAMQRFKVIANL